jgi:hypothetical protein
MKRRRKYKGPVETEVVYAASLRGFSESINVDQGDDEALVGTSKIVMQPEGG